MEKLQSADGTANSELLVPFKDKVLLEYNKDNAIFAVQGNDKQMTLAIQYYCAG